MTSDSTRFDRLAHAIRREIDARLQPSYLQMTSIALLMVGIIMLLASFATSDQGRTLFGPPLGNDFAGFYVAAQILERGQATQLYDQEVHQEMYHELLPKLSPNDAIPYVHPPFVAGVLRPLTLVPYAIAVALWLVLSLGMFVAGIWCLVRSSPEFVKGRSSLVLLLSLSFEPFLMECWLGGQLSAVGFFSYALAWLALSRNRPFLAGTALGMTFYKPTLLLLVLPMLVVGRCWRMLGGMTITGAFLAGLSIAFVGWDVSVGYLDVLLSFRKSTSGGRLEILTWKYVDLNNSLRLLFGGKSSAQQFVFLAFSIVPFVLLAKAWWQWPKIDLCQRQICWSAMLAWLPVLNLYVGVYDSIFVVQSVLLAADWRLRRDDSNQQLTRSGLAYWALVIAGTAWFSQSLARISGVQVYTLALIGWGFWTLRQTSASPIHSEMESVAKSISGATS